jgi:Cu(I)/Ag(I) efflux system periplasmic protein CusF
MNILIKVIAICLVWFPQTLQALESQAKATSAETSETKLVYTKAEVRRIDLTNQKITLKHGEIKNLDMPPMTMVFVVKDLALIDQLTVGDRVRFAAINDNGVFTITHLKRLKRTQ